MKKALLCLIIISAIVLCGCMPTPDEEYVVNKGDDKAGEEIESTAAPSEPIVQPVFPEHWEDDIKTEYGQMLVNADIVTAGQDTYPVRLVGKHTFTAEETAAVANIFFADMTGKQKGTMNTREKYEEALKTVAGSDLPEETKAEHMNTLNEMIRSAKASEERFTPASAFEAADFENRETTDHIVKLKNGDNGRLTPSRSLMSMAKSAWTMVQSKELIERNGEGYAGEKDAFVKAEIPFETALAAAEEFLRAIGSEGFVLAQSDEARFIDYCDLHIISSGWELKYQRTFGYAAVNAFEHDAADNDPIGKVGGDKNYSYGWKCEWIEIYVSENGVEQFEWHNPLEDKGWANENVQLMGFDELEKIVTRYFSAKLGNSEFWAPFYYQIDEMTLSAVPTAKKDSDDAYMMPVWVCRIGKYHSMADDSYSCFYYPGEQKLLGWSTVAFNAIDGTRAIVPWAP